MPWNSTAPLGSVSVKANRTILQQNTTYIQTTMGNSIVGTNTVTTRDHFWNIGANEDGRHRFIQSPAFTVGGVPTNPVIGTGMDSVLYAKTTNARVEWFHRNAQGVYQWMPSVITGTVNVTSTSSFVDVAVVPANVYGEVIFHRKVDDATPADSEALIQTGAFLSNNNTVQGYSNRIKLESSSDDYFLELENDDTTDLNLRVRRGLDGSHVWNYIILYRAV